MTAIVPVSVSAFLQKACADLKVIRFWKCFSFTGFPDVIPTSWLIV